MSSSLLPLYDAELDVQAYNIYQPLESILPYDLPKRHVNTAVDSAKPAAVLASPFAKKTVEPALDTYCKACKKKFSNEPTFVNHLKSAKHIANEKKLKPASKGPANNQKLAVHPKVQEALSMLEQAEKSDDATAALTTYWTQAQTLYALKRPQYTEKALRMLIDLINASPTTTFSSAQITSFLYNARLALARLLCIYQQLDDARSVYLDALAGKWKLETPELLGIARRIRTLSIHDLLEACDQLATKYLTRERNRTKPAPALTDANNSIASILCEAAHLFAQEGQNYQNTPSEHVALALYATCSLVCPFEPTSGITKDDIYYLMIQVYTSLEDLDYRIVDIYALDTANVWHMFNALLIAIEIDDLVRAQTIEASLRQSLYPDVQLLCSLYKQKTALSIDNDTLQQQLDFILLLLEQTQDPLVIRNQGQKEQLDIIDRIRNCI
ncbi:C2H2-type zinc finger transcription factor [Mucor lusitanicus]|uniref:C2H2-type zinc finger transcription factor n=1 Tax=Mucor circinelloides f. lusitanicus TaxID=29924 RepID=A0A8H4F537_MUCCL|nr:C2H2-type zinc finger transcription factor [Mucor lusitanicus]